MTSRRHRMFMIILIGMVATCAVPRWVFGEEAPEVAAINDVLMASIVERVCEDLERKYVFEDDARRMCGLLHTSFGSGAYANLDSLAAFTERLTQDLRSVRRDPHLEVSTIDPVDEQIEEDLDHHDPEYLRRLNSRFRKVEILEGNVGYLALDGFANDDGAGAAAVAAMNFLARTDALIIDLRENGGGGAAIIQLLISYLCEGREQLSSIYIRESDTELQFWTNRFVEGPRLADVPVWVLVSNRTFSAAEAFAYDLKHLGRGQIVGEATRGGAHPVHNVDYPDLGITVRVPFARAVNPVTGGNWEEVGVQPDVNVPSEDALAVSHAAALRFILEKEDDPAWREWLQRALDVVISQTK
jgi:hypothetical protein